jgi:hypothetical protein
VPLKIKKCSRHQQKILLGILITPPDFYNLIQAIIDYKPINTALDCYTKSPVSKFDLLDELESEFGLKYEVDKSVSIINSTGIKMNYYSTSRVSNNIGYKPKNTSKKGIIQIIGKLLSN